MSYILIDAKKVISERKLSRKTKSKAEFCLTYILPCIILVWEIEMKWIRVGVVILVLVIMIVSAKGCKNIEYEFDERDFQFSIAVCTTTFVHGERIEVFSTLKNLSERTAIITTLSDDRFIRYYITPAYVFQESSSPTFFTTEKIESSDYLERTRILWVGWLTPPAPGVRELEAVATFYLNRGMPNQQRFEVTSNVIELNILEAGN